MMIYVYLERLRIFELKYPDRHEQTDLTLSTFSSVLDDLGRPDFGFFNVDPFPNEWNAWCII